MPDLFVCLLWKTGRGFQMLPMTRLGVTCNRGLGECHLENVMFKQPAIFLAGQEEGTCIYGLTTTSTLTVSWWSTDGNVGPDNVQFLLPQSYCGLHVQ